MDGFGACFFKPRLVKQLGCYKLSENQGYFRGKTMDDGGEESKHVGEVVRG